MTNVICCPISGGSLCVQLAIIRDLCNANYKYNIYMGSSGGAISIFSMIAGCHTSYGINSVVKYIDLKYLMKNWSTIPLMPSWVFGYSKGTFFNYSPYCFTNIASLVNESILLDNEFWIGTTNLTDSAQQALFCTTTKSRSILNPFSSYFSTHYLNGNCDKFSKVLVSSACIPFVMPHVDIEIEGIQNTLVDGGLRASSPLTFLASHLPDSMHLDYIACDDVDVPMYQNNKNNMLNRGLLTTQEIIRCNNIREHEILLETFQRNMNRVPDSEGDVSIHLLKHLKHARKSYYKTVVEFYPDMKCELNLLTLTSSKISKAMDCVSLNYKYRLWYC